MTRKSKIKGLAEEISDLTINNPFLYQKAVFDLKEYIGRLNSTKAENQTSDPRIPIKRSDGIATFLSRLNNATTTSQARISKSSEGKTVVTYVNESQLKGSQVVESGGLVQGNKITTVSSKKLEGNKRKKI